MADNFSNYGVGVQQINLLWIMNAKEAVATAAQRLGDPEIDNKQVRWSLFVLKSQIEALFVPSSLYADCFSPSCKSLASSFYDSLLPEVASDKFDVDLTDWRRATFKTDADRFLTIFENELQSLPLFLVLRKDALDTDALVNDAARLFPLSLAQKVPNAVVDLKAAGRCLAFELPTAAGFHLFRVMEAVLRCYYKLVTNEELPNNPNIGNLLNCLRTKKKGSDKITGAIKQLTDLHRNPLIHPEADLDMEEAFTTYGLVRSAVSAMLSKLPDAKVSVEEESSESLLQNLQEIHHIQAPAQSE